jgi:hypothetical protein
MTTAKVNSNEFLIFISKAALIVSFVVLTASGLNYHGLKYARSRGTECTQGMLILNVPESHMCCSSALHSNDWVCSGGYDFLERFLVSHWALVLPLIPCLLSILTENFLLKRSGQAAVNYQAALKRLIVYFSIVVMRTVIITSFF